MLLRTSMLLLWIFAGTIVFAKTAAAAESAVTGPRMTDAELLQAVNLQYPGLEAAAKAFEKGNQQASLDALADFFRHQKTAFDFVGKGPRGKSAEGSSVKDIMLHRLWVGGIPYAFPGDVDWHFNATAMPGSKYALTHEWTWCLNRHETFTLLAQEYRATGDEKYAREFAKLLASWIRQCPVPATGTTRAPLTAWRTIETGIRTSRSWPISLSAFRASPSMSNRLLLDWLKLWIEHAQYLMREPTKGNWLTMEMNGLYHIGTLIPFAKEAETWRNTAAERLQKEMDVQVYPDGAQFELAPGYHNVALRNMLGIYRAAKNCGQKLPDDYISGVEKMFAYDMWSMLPNRTSPNWNDSGYADQLDMLKDAAVLFPNRKDFRWVASDGKEGSPPDHTSHFFPWAGQAIMRSGWERDAMYLAIEVGPFGVSHQHEDKLSIIIAGDHPLLVDAGNYMYDDSQWRKYVISSRAHNLVLVDGGDQQRRMQPETKAVTKPMEADFQTNDKFDFVRGIYDNGFEGGGRVRHTREVMFDKVDKLFIVRDRLETLDDKAHLYEALWHLDTPALVEQAKIGIYETKNKTGDNLRLVTQTGSNLDCKVVKGQEKPVVQGWLPSNSNLGVRPIPCVICGRKGKNVEFLTVFQPLKKGAEPRVDAATFQNGSVEVTWSDSHKTTLAWPK